MKKALFLDRDGVINKEINYLYRIKDVIFIEGVFEQLKIFQENNYLLFIITNQAGISKGYYREEDYLKLNNWMINKFKEKDIYITKVYHCPYHPDYNNYLEYKNDRKPNPGMIIKAKKEFNIDLNKSILIGDKESDIEAGKNAGIKTNILVRSGHRIDESKTIADGIINDISSLYSYIFGGENSDN